MADGEDLMAQLPEHLSICILELFDAETLFNCTKVNRDWNAITDRLQPRIWFEACLNAGIDVEEDTHHVASEWKAFFITTVQRLRDMRICNCYETVFYTFKEPPRAVSCHNDQVAIALSDCVRILDTSLDSEECVEIPCCFETSFLKFVGSMLIAASTDGFVEYWSIELENRIHEIRVPIDHQGILLSIDFLKEYSILVRSIHTENNDSITIIYICRIFGKYIYSKINVNDKIIHRVILAPNPDSPTGDHEKKTCFLFGLAEDCVRMWTVEIRSESFSVQFYTSIRIPRVRNINEEAADSPPFGFLFDGTEVFFMTPCTENSGTIWAWNFREKTIRYIQNDHPVINLLGVGKKYLIYKYRPIDERDDIVCAVDKITQRFVAHISAPRIPSGNSCISLGNTSWMDGLNGNNDIGLVLVSQLEDPLTVEFVQYAPRH